MRKYLRQNRLRQLELEKLFAIAQDAEVGLAGRGGKCSQLSQDAIQEKPGVRKGVAAIANSVMLDGKDDESWGARKGGRSTDKRGDRVDASSRSSTTGSWGSGGTRRTQNSQNESNGWGRTRFPDSVNSSSKNGRERRPQRRFELGGLALCWNRFT